MHWFRAVNPLGLKPVFFQIVTVYHTGLIYQF